MKHLNLLREFVRATLREVDVLPPEKDPRQGGTSSSAVPDKDAAIAAAQQDEKTGKQLNKASPQYQKKEETRKKVQDLVKRKVQGGGMASDDDLSKYLSDEDRVRKDGKFGDDEDIKLALTALKAVPVSVWKQLR